MIGSVASWVVIAAAAIPFFLRTRAPKAIPVEVRDYYGERREKR